MREGIRLNEIIHIELKDKDGNMKYEKTIINDKEVQEK